MSSNRSSYWLAAATAAVVFAIYLVTLAPTTAFWDTSEYITAAHVIGIPHPPGNPLFVMLAHLFGLLPLASSYAVRINLFAAITSAAAAGLWFLVAERWLESVVSQRTPRRVAAVAGVLVGATMWTVWNQSTVNEKVYTVSLLFTALVTWLVIRWADRVGDPRRDRWLVLVAYLLALTSTNHLMGVLAAPTVLVYVLATDWRVLLRWRVMVPVAIAVVIGLTPNTVFLPIRAAALPPINEGEPIGLGAICAATGGWSHCSQALSDVLHRVQYGKPSVLVRQSPLWAQLDMYWNYFAWQFARDTGPGARFWTALFTTIGVGGLWRLGRRDRRAGLAAATTLATLTVALVFYLNFRYQYSFDRADITFDLREVRERDYFFLSSFSFFGILVALGIGAMMSGAADWLQGRVSRRVAWSLTLPLGLLPLVPILGNRATASRAHEYAAADFARDLLESVEPYGVLITGADNDLFPLWYAQEVERIRPDVTVANTSLMNTTWHLKQLVRRPTPAFDPSRSAPLWSRPDSGAAPIRPTSPVLSLTESQIDSLPDLFRAPAGPVRFGNIEINFGSQILERRDLATLLLIRDSLGRRPVYFAWSVAGFPDQRFGLSPYLVSQGLVRRLNDGPVRPVGSIVNTPGIGLVDVVRTDQLLSSVYRPATIARPRAHGWVDSASRNIPDLYYFAYASFAAALRQVGDSVKAARADSVARAVTAGLGGN